LAAAGGFAVIHAQALSLASRRALAGRQDPIFEEVTGSALVSP
jgi:hypothetical protein